MEVRFSSERVFHDIMHPYGVESNVHKAIVNSLDLAASKSGSIKMA